MPIYVVKGTITRTFAAYYVEADSEEEAEEATLNKVYKGQLGSQFVHAEVEDIEERKN